MLHPNPHRPSSTAPLVAALLLLAWWLTDHYPPWTSFHSEVPAALAGLLAFGGALRAQHRTQGASRTTYALLACALIPWAQWAGGVVTFHGDALLASLYLAAIALCYWAGHTADSNERGRLLSAIAAALLIAAILTTGVLLHQWFGLESLNEMLVARGVPGARAGGNLGQPNHTATLLCMGLAALILFRHRGLVGNKVTTLAAAYLALGLALTQSRVPWLVMVLLAIVLTWRREALFDTLKLPLNAMLSWLVGYALVFWAVGALPEIVLGAAVPNDPNASRLGPGLRPILWGQWLEALLSAPWHGYGWMQGRAVQQAAALARPSVEGSDYAHNLVLDLLAWNGLPLGGLLVVAMLVWYVRAAKAADGAAQAFRLAVVTALGAHSLVEYPFSYTYFLVPAALLAGQLSAGAKMSPRRNALHFYIAIACASAVLAGSVAVTRDYLRVEPDVRALREQTARIGGLRVTEPVRGLWVLDQMEAFSRASRIRPTQGMDRVELDDLLSTAHRFPNTWLLQQSSMALALNGRQREAHEKMRLLCALYGDGFYRITVARMAEITREQALATQPFVASLVLPATAAPDVRRDLWHLCLQR